MAAKMVWCKEERINLGCQKPPDKRWRCPDCKQRFVICSRRVDGEYVYWAPAHKKRAK